MGDANETGWRIEDGYTTVCTGRPHPADGAPHLREWVMNHKKRRPANRRAGCKMCKTWKINGYRTERDEGKAFSAHRRRLHAGQDLCDWLGLTRSGRSV
jgi:hypothetical protein